MRGKRKRTTRMLRELLETASDLSLYGLVSKADKKRMEALCEVPRRSTPGHKVSPVIIPAVRND